MKCVVDDCIYAVLGHTQLSGNLILRYSSVCHDDIMHIDSGTLCGEGDWSSPTGVIFQTIPAKFEFSIPLLHHVV